MDLMNLINKSTLRINDILSGMFRAINIKLIDFKIEYGKAWNKDIEKKEIVLVAWFARGGALHCTLLCARS